MGPIKSCIETHAARGIGTLLACAAMLSAPAQGAARFDIGEITIAETQRAIAEHRVSCHQVIEQYLDRILAYDQSTRLNSLILVNPHAVAEADRFDTEFKRTQKIHGLQCIGVIVKDNYDTKDLQTTGGSLAMKWFVPATDAFMVQRIRAAGAIILAKSNMAEWAFSPYETVSSIAGITRNPYNLDYVPAGSSGGTAAAVAANLGAIGLGTDTGNSIRGPSSHNALVGIRPTIGLTSRDGIIPLFLGADVGGPIVRTVEDAAALLDVVAGYDPLDPVTQNSVGHIPKSYKAFLDSQGLRGARIGVFRAYLDAPTGDPQIKELTEKAIQDLKAQGAKIVDPFVIPDFEALTKNIFCGDFQSDLNGYLEKHGQGAPYKTLAEIIDSGLYLPYIEGRLKSTAGAKPGSDADRTVCPDVYHNEKKIAFRAAIRAAMAANKVQAIIYPTWSNAPRRVGDEKSPAGDNSQVLSPQTGFPAITVPMGYTHGELPAGLTFLGDAFDEGTLIKFAYAYEQATKHRHAPPNFPPLN
ncbi:MAG TPA: amidase family protein [Steroidobacteraceae bacterium]|jgi:Asp-tRNA(Asn)/Glu-tRNA(Gln) amidotransferase A subunit family amidase